ncbi:hypothetical protein [Aeromonas piscicola]|uniref:hypothetical protein n=1 Tax=Aeromonas piscicola TaxID=600645 RepID=UPI0028E5AFB6|nr:hypothetical protein [Aeromonas piscicola]
MELVLKLPSDYPIEYAPAAQDVVQLAATHNWDLLNQVPVCTDLYGKVIAQFGQLEWNCSAFSSEIGLHKSKWQFDFRFLANSPRLMLQAKLVSYGWLYHVGHRSGHKCKLSTLASRVNFQLKRIMSFLQQQGSDDLCDLNIPYVWDLWEQDLKRAQLSSRSIELTFNVLLALDRLGDWLPFRLTLPTINFKQLAVKLAAEGKKQPNQFLVIPETLVDIIYGESVNLVEQVWPHRAALAQLERDLQANYAAGRAVADHKIALKHWTPQHDANGKLDTNWYSSAINRAAPKTQTAIVINALVDTGLLPEGTVPYNWFAAWRNKLQAACFVCCSSFSGMRVSEVFELRQDSFCTYTVGGKVFHAVRAATHKLAAGKKRDEWLCSPVVEKAIEVAMELSASQREQLQQLAQCSGDHGHAHTLRAMSDCLWLIQGNRSQPPRVQSRAGWNKRLQLYTKHLGAIIDEKALAECRLLNPRSHGTIATKVKIGETWPLSTHQFRRTFASFAVRYHLAHPIALKQQLKHLALRMSEWYCNGGIEARLEDIQVDSEITTALNEAKIEYTTTTYDRWYNSDERLSGGYGKTVVAMRNNKPVIYSSWENLLRLVKEMRLTLHGTLHSYCSNGYECDMAGVVNPAFCVECSGSVIDADKAQWWKMTHTRLTAYLHEQFTVSLGEYSHFITQIRAAENVMRDHQIDYVAYKHPVEITNL